MAKVKQSDLPSDYGALLKAVKERVRPAQYEALKVVNKELVGRNVFYMREFYLLYRNDTRVQPVVAQIALIKRFTNDSV